MLIGYARVSTDDQNLDLQRDALRLAGCAKIYEDRMSGAKAARPGLSMALEVSRAGDVLTVWRLDRLGRSLHDLILLGRKLDEMGVGLMSVREKIDTSSSGGRLVILRADRGDEAAHHEPEEPPPFHRPRNRTTCRARHRDTGWPCAGAGRAAHPHYGEPLPAALGTGRRAHGPATASRAVPGRAQQ